MAAISIALCIIGVGFAWLLTRKRAPAAVSLPVNSIWSFTEDQKNSLAVTLLRKNATTGNLEAIPGQRRALEQMKITYGKPLIVPVSISATFPGQSSSPMTVWGVRMFHSGAGTGWSMPEHPINVAFPSALIVPAGQKVSCTYDMPVGLMGKLTCAVGTIRASSASIRRFSQRHQDAAGYGDHRWNGGEVDCYSIGNTVRGVQERVTGRHFR
jgi:hypothetical protein